MFVPRKSSPCYRLLLEEYLIKLARERSKVSPGNQCFGKSRRRRESRATLWNAISATVNKSGGCGCDGSTFDPDDPAVRVAEHPRVGLVIRTATAKTSALAGKYAYFSIGRRFARVELFEPLGRVQRPGICFKTIRCGNVSG